MTLSRISVFLIPREICAVTCLFILGKYNTLFRKDIFFQKLIKK